MHADELPIADPCHADWDAMTPAGARRFCAACSRHVHDLSPLRESEARALLRAAPGRLCVRYTVAPGGAIRFQPEPAPALVQLRRPAPAAPPDPAARGRAGAAALLLAACTPHEPDANTRPLAAHVEPADLTPPHDTRLIGQVPYAPPPPPPPLAPSIEPPPPAMVKMGDLAPPAARPRADTRMGKLPLRDPDPAPCDPPEAVWMGEAPALE